MRPSLAIRYSVFMMMFISLFYFVGCVSVPKKTEKIRDVSLSLNAVALDKKTFSPRSGEEVIIRYKPSFASTVTVDIYNNLGELVRRLDNKKDVSVLMQKTVWDGKDEKGAVVPNGVYFYAIELSSKEKRNYIYNPYKKTHGKKLKVISSSYDEETKQIYYKLPQAAMVRIRVGLKDGGPLLATPLDWSAKEAGSHAIGWDGKDSSGLINLASHPKRNLVIFTYSLADNSIIVEGEKQRRSNLEMSKLNLPKDRHRHALDNPGVCFEPRINIEFLTEATVQEGASEVSGVMPVKVSVDPEDLLVVENSRYEIMFYVDTVFLFEDELGFSPFTYMWDTQGLSEGEHLLTVNLWTYDDHCGVATKRIKVINE